LDSVNNPGEYAAVRSAAAMRLLNDRAVIRVSGDDRVSFLHGMCSADIKGLKADAVAMGLFLTEHAHVIADFFAYGTDENALLLEMDKMAWPRARAHLEKFLVADDVEMEQMDGVALLDLEGPAADSILKATVGIEQMPERWRQIVVDGLRVANLPRNGGPAFTIFGPQARVAALIEDLRKRGVAEASAGTTETIRIEHGIACVGVDTVEKTIALEARLEPSISFSKGCYVGQETVERATARGSLKKRLMGLRISGERVPEANAAVLLEGKEVGRLSSVASSPRLGIIGLAILHHSAWTDGASVAIADCVGQMAAKISELPMQ
jgi:folate-binding protein YgfZ